MFKVKILIVVVKGYDHQFKMKEDSFTNLFLSRFMIHKNPWISDRSLSDHNSVEITFVLKSLLMRFNSTVAYKDTCISDSFLHIINILPVNTSGVRLLICSTVNSYRFTVWSCRDDKLFLRDFIIISQTSTSLYTEGERSNDFRKTFDKFERLFFVFHHTCTSSARHHFWRWTSDIEFYTRESRISCDDIFCRCDQIFMISSIDLCYRLSFKCSSYDMMY